MEHVSLFVTNLEDSIAFYKKYIGLDIVGDMREMGRPIVFLARNEKDTKLELIENKENPYKGSGIFIGFPVENVRKTYDWFQSEGLEVSEISSPIPNINFFFVKDPAGLQVQLIGQK